MNLEKFKKFFGFPLDKKHKENVERELCNYLYHTGKIICIIIIISQLIMMISISARDGGPFATPRRQWYFCMYIILLCISLIFMFVFSYLWNKKKEHCTCYINLWVIYVTFFCLWGCVITLLDQLGGNDLSVFSYIMLTAAAFSVLKLGQSIVVFGGCFLFLNLLLPGIQTVSGNEFSNIVNTFFITSLAIFVSTMLYRSRVFTYYDKMLIHQQYEEISHMNNLLNLKVMTDDLTKMNNRRYLEDVLQKKLSTHSNQEPITGMMIDIDYFKQFNDTYGHQKGDYCLQNIAKVILDFTNSENAHAIRYGGEEFFICIFNCDEENAKLKSECLRKIIEYCNFERDDVPSKCVTVSIGVHTKKVEELITLNEFISYCDKALYIAKEQGRNCVAFY
ncbi:GGDEF domain-containing protein [Clostridioides sp. ZZV15-6388]|uniref:GGDEF domain-containing protein n=1 Tax=unclassified Clostridioides TaxID=2635829 RepID=UPI001D10890D|nr:GGDEF domain-containing protein [Clostridioides sp. ZZV15-6388]MCC0667555.1 GGDEF domain-containing protein [Clostridioides sp. ZZV14-6153]